MNREAKDERITWWCILTWWDGVKEKLKKVLTPTKAIQDLKIFTALV